MLFRIQKLSTASGRYFQNGYSVKTLWRSATSIPSPPNRQLRSDFWIPQAELPQNAGDEVDAGQLLVRAGYLRQAYSGIFHMLPLGLRVQAKLEALIDKHMQSLQASKVSLSSISSQKAWAKSGRLLAGRESEFLTFEDRHKARWLLAPTHEEEITQVVKDVVHAPSHLPIRLYQISRKYRDERRPRGGLLRGREFLMKDLYTFDKTDTEAKKTYSLVRKAYSNLFDELNVPYIEARADSGNMGGSLSHEFHFPSRLGEDDLITCSTCDYAKNEEFVPSLPQPVSYHAHVQDQTLVLSNKGQELLEAYIPDLLPSADHVDEGQRLLTAAFLSQDRSAIVKVVVTVPMQSQAAINPFVVQKTMKDQIAFDAGIEDPLDRFEEFIKRNELEDQGSPPQRQPVVHYLFDGVTSGEVIVTTLVDDLEWRKAFNIKMGVIRGLPDEEGQKTELLKKQTGDPCPECSKTARAGTLNVTKAIEVGHTFHLGDRYSSKFDLVVPKSHPPEIVSMGCHGIGVSRLIAASAAALSDARGLIWPRAIAPFEVLIVYNVDEKHQDTTEPANQIYDSLASSEHPADVLMDDRDGVSIPWKLKDADLIGYPILVVLGKGWINDKLVEIQCRRLNIKEHLPFEEVTSRVQDVLSQL